MAGLDEQAQWENEIYQIETTDPVVGGPPDLAQGQGITNVPHQMLANRTAWLKAQVDALNAILANGLDQYATDAELAAAIANFVTQAEIDAAINGLIDGAPAALNTLKELSDALTNNDDAIAALTAQIAGKLDAAAYTAADILAKLKTVDGDGSGLNADLLDGLSSSSFARSVRTLSAGTGLSGGGDLTANRTISASIPTKAEAEAGAINNKLMTPLRTKQAIDAAQSNALATAWVNFNGQGTVAIREAYNVSSVTDLGAGRYRVNFSTPMANTNYGIFGLHGNAATAGDERNDLYIDGKTTTYAQFYTTNVHGSAGDWDNVSILIMGGQ